MRHKGWLYDELLSEQIWKCFKATGTRLVLLSTKPRVDWFKQSWSIRSSIHATFSSSGSHFLGMCVPRPCIYLTTLRNPIAQHISAHHYFCTLGAENRHLWTPQMKAQGKCDLDILQWKKQDTELKDIGYNTISIFAPETNLTSTNKILSAISILKHPWTIDVSSSFYSDLDKLMNFKLAGA
mmetsp:Transcript_22371/g.28953  ORF Transcript_22371/g.28953 Transcript_22371/m.28953 type:complete len:182 (-) Transcript_22371:3827-4372(-)